MVKFEITLPIDMATSTAIKKENSESTDFEKKEKFQSNEVNPRPLSRKAEEAKIFLERNPIPKEFLKS
ncbi:hypothetical protein ASG33_11565 [Dyadobacter sp. Leaf189]|nr:hypothetical protein ASG33_11565 [Dyadobacter sp. Leaf189]